MAMKKDGGKKKEHHYRGAWAVIVPSHIGSANIGGSSGIGNRFISPGESILPAAILG